MRDPIPPPSPILRVLPDEPPPPRLGKRGKGIGREGAPPTGGLATEGLLSNPLYLNLWPLLCSLQTAGEGVGEGGLKKSPQVRLHMRLPTETWTAQPESKNHGKVREQEERRGGDAENKIFKGLRPRSGEGRNPDSPTSVLL